MFLDFVFNFCCSKRQKNEPDTLSVHSRKSQEDQFLEQRRLEFDQGVKSKQSSVVGSPTDNYLVKEVLPKKSSFEEEDHVQQQIYKDHLSKTMQNGHALPTLKRQLLLYRRCQSDEDLKVKKKIGKSKKPDDQKRVVKIWDQDEDQLLRKYHAEYDGNWHRIAPLIPGRNISQCSQRWRRINPIQNKQKWTFEEDQRVIELVKSKGKNWTMLSKEFPGRTGKQIRERYLNKLDPALQVGPWTDAEDQIILEQFKEIGPKWSQVASKLKGRSENMVKNRFYSHIQKSKLGIQNKYQVVNNGQTDFYSDTSENNKPYSENHSSNNGSSAFTYSYNDDDEMEFEQDYDIDESFNQKMKLE